MKKRLPVTLEKQKKQSSRTLKNPKKPVMIKKGGSLRGIAFKPSIIN